MDLTQLANLGEFIGGVAVLVTLVYLAVQVRSARDDLRYRGATDVIDRTYQAYSPVYEGRNAEILWNGLSGTGTLSDTDAFVFDLLMRRHAGALSEAMRDLEAGVISPELIDFLGAHYRRVLTSRPGGIKWFRDNSEEFGGEIDLFRLIPQTGAVSQEVS
jgi:hypothetical protein